MINKPGVTSLKIAFVAMTAIALTSSCSMLEKNTTLEFVPEVYPGYLQGYLAKEELPNSLTLLPPPPTENSIAKALDEEINQQGFTLRNGPRWALAAEDSVLFFPHAASTFSCAINASITEQDTPQLYRLLRRSLADAAYVTYAAKYHYNRARPFVVNKQPHCSKEEEVRKNTSYPSGHSAIGWTWALILTEIAPEYADAILKRGWEFGQSRSVCNVHWQSDINSGRVVAAAVVARLHSNAKFLTAVKASVEELTSIREKNLLPQGDCNGGSTTKAK